MRREIGGVLIAGILIGAQLSCSDVNPGTADTPCAANLMKIRDALQVHAAAKNGRYPDTLGTLVDERRIDASVLRCPGGQGGKPGGQYLYFGKGLGQPAVSDTVLVVDDADRHLNSRLGLFTDGTVRILTRDELARVKQRETSPVASSRPGA